MSKEETVLSSVRKALGNDGNMSTQPSDLSTWPPVGRVLARIDPPDLIPRFEQELERVAGSAHRVQSRSEIGPLLARILGGDRPRGVVLSRNPLLARLDLGSISVRFDIPAWPWPAASAGTANNEDPAHGPSYRDRCFGAAAGITGLDFALAESGSLALTSATEGAQLCSLAPAIHIAFYLRNQVAESLEEVLGRLPRGGRSIVFITGTSRTADIEQILIRGVHGPRELHAILVEESCLASPD
jgi:L-lactate utilization protein LutC